MHEFEVLPQIGAECLNGMFGLLRVIHAQRPDRIQRVEQEMRLDLGHGKLCGDPLLFSPETSGFFRISVDLLRKV